MTTIVVTNADLERIRARLANLQAEVDRLQDENVRMRRMASGLTWCAACGGLCERIGRWRRYCSPACRRAAYNAVRRSRYSQARDLGVPGRLASNRRTS